MLNELQQDFNTIIQSWRKYSCPDCKGRLETNAHKGGLLLLICNTCKKSFFIKFGSVCF